MNADDTRRECAGRGTVRVAVVRGLVLVAVFAASLAVRRQGEDWPRLHPDGVKVERWLRHVYDHAAVRDQVYPGGFFTLFRPVYRIAVGWRAWRIERAEGDAPDRARLARELDVILLARRLNAVLGAGTAVLVCLMAWCVTGRFAAGWFAGVLVGFCPFFVEHAGYAETDVAMVFTLTLALLLWAREQRRHAWGWLAAAALATGFAVGTKYTLVPLVPVALTFCLRPGASVRERAWRSALAVFAVLTLVCVGFVVANPAVLEPGWFFKRLAVEAGGVLDESRGVIGEAYGRPYARFCHQLRGLLRFAGAYGWAWNTVCVVGVWRLFAGRERAFWRVTLLFPLAAVAYLLLKAPWVRMQETFMLLPAAACAAGATIAWLTGLCGRSVGRRATVAAAAAAICLVVIAQGIGRVSLFTRLDTRHAAQAWLQRHLPHGRTVGLEIYTKAQPGFPVPVRETVALHKVEQQGIERVRELGCDYVLRNETLEGRGLRDPFSGRLYPGFDAARQAFLAGSERVADWAPLRPCDATTFAFVNNRLALYGTRRYAGSSPGEVGERAAVAGVEEVRGAIPRPLLLLEERSVFLFPSSGVVGGDLSLGLGGGAVTVRVGGPLGDAGTDARAVVRNAGEKAVRIRLSGPGTCRTLAVAPGARYGVSLDPPRWATGFRQFAKYRFELMGGESLDGCRVDLLTGAAGVPPVPPQARRLADVPPEAVRVNGVSGFYYDEFARIHVATRDRSERLRPVDGRPRHFRIDLPVEVPAGLWRIAFELRASGPMNESLEVDVVDGEGRACASSSWAAGEPDTWHNVTFDMRTDRAVRCGVTLVSSRDTTLDVRNARVEWSLRQRLLDLAAPVRGPAGP